MTTMRNAPNYVMFISLHLECVGLNWCGKTWLATWHTVIWFIFIPKTFMSDIFRSRTEAILLFKQPQNLNLNQITVVSFLIGIFNSVHINSLLFSIVAFLSL